MSESTISQAHAASEHTRLRAFGLSLLANTPLPGAWRDTSEQGLFAEPILHLRAAPPQAIAEGWSGMDTVGDTVGWEGMIDGARFVVERGPAGDHRFVHDGRAVHHLSADTSLLLCGPDTAGEPLRWRVVLDSVLFSAALLRGYEALHAGAVRTDRGALAITAGTGGGKSTLLSELLRGGLVLMADDILALEPSAGTGPPLAHPAPPLMTVPAARISMLSEIGSPQTIASLEQEHWMAVPVHPAPLPLSALVVLNRSPGLATSLHRARNPLAVLMGSLLRFPRVPERERTRFEMAGAIASCVPIWELCADPSVAPAALAGLLREGVIESQAPAPSR